MEEILILYDSLEMLASSANEQIEYLKKIGIDFGNIDDLTEEISNSFEREEKSNDEDNFGEYDE